MGLELCSQTWLQAFLGDPRPNHNLSGPAPSAVTLG